MATQRLCMQLQEQRQEVTCDAYLDGLGGCAHSAPRANHDASGNDERPQGPGGHQPPPQSLRLANLLTQPCASLDCSGGTLRNEDGNSNHGDPFNSWYFTDPLPEESTCTNCSQEGAKVDHYLVLTASALVKSIVSPWFQLCDAWQTLEWKDVTRAWLWGAPTLAEIDVSHLYLYTDGSGGSQKAGEERSAAWSLVILASDQNMNQAVVGFSGRTAETSELRPWHVGITSDDSYAMEITAMTFALLWLAQDDKYSGIPATICFDSEAAAYAARGTTIDGEKMECLSRRRWPSQYNSAALLRGITYTPTMVTH